MLDLSKILNFVGLLNMFRHVERVVLANGEKRWENDVEHSYHLAMLAWYIAESHALPLNRDLLVRYALVHDLVEVYAGDTYIYTTNQSEKDSKKAREEKAAVELRENFPEFSGLHELIHQYEKREDKESRFVYALDKIQPILNIYMDGGRTWKEKEVTIQMLVDAKKHQVALSPEVSACFEELVMLLKKDEEKLFTVAI
ncbi:MAG: hypothetical protein A3D67_00300 [Candidatus Lloydbacteria bacterium RIFCSPHIGHO2_02_FULL_51_22]|uniref:5'-deoxynucleotidase n=2 Tax=Candidatus Lloydiibacteriota TaxID=1817910 RepID=A0A1G2DE16_9BACT|nr:MAG: hypothetical protein A3D67_00300 [Candidatus Lloydbacteria bacterium RIFCSPHIGHO2_02_FULL_51_22]OGZ15311.1 MAG: hypothetical protein A3J08_00845 [Candidatus Lloydbacteria bacterium RIFCSPLOWO2_02_FULL_51_11]